MMFAANARGALPFISFVHMHATIAIYSLLRATPITVAMALPLQYAKEYSRVADIYSLHEATSTYTSHVFMSTSLRVATPTNLSRYLLAYREYILLGT